MPDTSHPPYSAGSLTLPKQLNRWLDINPQNGPLRRTQSFITLPAFSQAFTWRGYSDIVVAFNYEGPNNFSLLQGVTLPSNPNYALAISWIDANNNITRYWLLYDVGEVIYFPQVPYTGQNIGKNFRLEVWSTSSSPAVQTTGIVLYTSVLGDQDYRYGVDFTLVNNDTPVTDFNNVNTALTLPADGGWKYNWNPTGFAPQHAGNMTSWHDSISNVNLAPQATPTVATTIGLTNNQLCMFTSSGYGINVGFTDPTNIISAVMVVNLLSSGVPQQLLQTSGGIQLVYDPVAHTLTLNSGGDTIIHGVNNGQWYVIVVNLTPIYGSFLYLFDLATATLIDFEVGNESSTGTTGPLTVGNGVFIVTDVVLGYNQFNFTDTPYDSTTPQNICNYYAQKYMSNTWTLPLTFPTNAVSQPNIPINYGPTFNNRRNDTI